MHIHISQQHIPSCLQSNTIFQGVLVHEEFMTIVKAIQEKRTFEVNVGFVSTGKELETAGEGFR